VIREREPNFLYLFVGMLVLLVGGPIVETILGHPAVILGQSALSALLLAGIWTLAPSHAAFRVGIVLVLASAGSTALAYFRPSQPLALTSLGIAWAFCLLSVLLCMRYVLARGRVTANHLLGATCVYLLLGAIWGLAYAAIHAVDPSVFRAADGTHTLDIDDCLYFSFVTLTTTGYGDIVPADRLVRTLAYLEGAAGQLYVAILVATLVTRYVAPSSEDA
jgi:voltage-gated potassium channel